MGNQLNDSRNNKIRLHVPAGNLSCLKEAVLHGADVVYFGFSGASNLRNFSGINFSVEDAKAGIDYTHRHGKKVLITVNSFPQSQQISCCHEAIDRASDLSADGVIVSDIGLLDYVKREHPELAVSLSVQAGACHYEAINFYKEEFDVDQVILPRTLTLEEMKKVEARTNVRLEIFAFGSLCINYEGKCFLSSFITGESTNTIGTCSTPNYLSFRRDDEWLVARMNGKAINKYEIGMLKNDSHFVEGLPREELSQWGNHFMINRRQICKGRYYNSNLDNTHYAFNDLVYLNILDILPRVIETGISAVKVEGRQRNPEYVKKAASLFRTAIDTYYKNPSEYSSPSSQDEICRDLFPDITPGTTCYCGK